ncbi:hypothetical protein DOY81_001877 [Sarcophaga bullata]|nr:hypothetical protein DOY81_001877 [Sarcophaga bullata]
MRSKSIGNRKSLLLFTIHQVTLKKDYLTFQRQQQTITIVRTNFC